MTGREFLRKAGTGAGKVLLIYFGILLALAALWFTPTLIHNVKTWLHVFYECIDSATVPSKTLGDMWANNSRCSALATRVVNESP
jgi:hypothetical protein